MCLLVVAVRGLRVLFLIIRLSAAGLCLLLHY